ncbi:MAG: tandem-95 repeat protein, partial [Bacteroidota bacterium]|nr:tandem-95 repeat protein [Bacteroidota bacterium]
PVEGSPVTYSITQQPQRGVLIGTPPSLKYKPNLNYNGSDSIKFVVNDGTTNSNTATVRITVTPVNDAPVAYDTLLTTNEDIPKAFTIRGSDVDGNPLTYHIVDSTKNGTLTGTVPNLTYTPKLNYNGTDSLSFRVHDGTLYSNTAKVRFTINAVNDPPVAYDTTITVAEDDSVTFTIRGDDPVEGSPVTYSITQQPQRGVLIGTPPSLKYKPNLNYNGSDSIKFVVNDGTTNSNTATVRITVTPVNDAPVAYDMSISTSINRDLLISLTAFDADYDSLIYKIKSLPQNGTYNNFDSTHGTLLYSPNYNFNGIDSIIFTARDSVYESNEAVVRISVIFQPAIIRGRKYNDLNGDGIWQSGIEPTMADWQITASKGVLTKTVLTDPIGYYELLFDSTETGIWQVTETNQIGWERTTPDYTVLIESQMDTTLHFGNFKTVTIFGYKFNDINGDGVWQQPGEPVLRDWEIIAKKNDIELNLTTDANGYYQFTFNSIHAGDWEIKEVMKNGWYQTAPGGTGAYIINIHSGFTADEKNFGNFEATKLSGYKFLDRNVNVVWDTLNEPALSGWVIKAVKDNNIRYDTTDAQGLYEFVFNTTEYGEWTISEVLKPGWLQTYPDTFNYVIFVSSGIYRNDLSFGNFYGGKVSGYKFHDYNGDGIWDSDEPPVSNWLIIAYRNGTAKTEITGASGFYEFIFGPGEYGQWTITEDVEPNWVQTYPPNQVHTVNVMEFSNIQHINFGNAKKRVLSGNIFYDHNENGINDFGDEGLRNWKMVIEYPSGWMDTTTTNASGSYEFINLDPGKYYIQQIVKDGWRQTKPNAPPIYEVILIGGRDTSGFDFGNFYLGDTIAYRTFSTSDYSKKSVSTRLYRGKYRMPSAGNVRDSVFTGGGILPEGLVIGVDRSDSAKDYAWFRTPTKYLKMLSRTFVYGDQPRAASYLTHKGEKKYHFAHRRYGNRLSSAVMTARTNLAASDMGITTLGLGDLLYIDKMDSSNPCNNKSIRQILGMADTALTLGKTLGYSQAFFDILDSVITKFNRAFVAPMDTISNKPLRIKSLVRLVDVHYLKRDTSTIPQVMKYEPGFTQEQPEKYHLYQNYPNPFNLVTNIEYYLPLESIVTLKIYNVLGQEVAVLIDQEQCEDGRNIISFDASQLSTGVYFYQINATPVEDGDNRFINVKKMILMK